MFYITKEEAEKIYNIWCSSEDTKFKVDWRDYDLEYDDDDEVCYVTEDDDYIKLTTLVSNSVSVQTAEWVYTEVNSWRD